ncbi:MAG: hypothetical protein IMZ65_03955, partial [Planctomycetes bacterium]|nr:hypothetical protein [Planctomycetota bacterium]
MAKTERRGYEAVLYRGTAGSTPSTLVNNVMDLELPATRGETQNTTRESGGYLSYDATMIDLTLTWKMLWDPADTDLLAIRTAFTSNTAIALKSLDLAGGKGWDADYKITEFSAPQPLDGEMVLSVKARPYNRLRAPATV